jgi:HNH endonuclease
MCGWAERNPVTEKIPLHIDHIDGDWRNNRPDNLRLLCPNHHALTSSYGALNRGKGRPYHVIKTADIEAKDEFLGLQTWAPRLSEGPVREQHARLVWGAPRGLWGYLVNPARQFVVAMGECLRTLDPDIHAEPKARGSILAINRCAALEQPLPAEMIFSAALTGVCFEHYARLAPLQ